MAKLSPGKLNVSVKPSFTAKVSETIDATSVSAATMMSDSPKVHWPVESMTFPPPLVNVPLLLPLTEREHVLPLPIIMLERTVMAPRELDMPLNGQSA